MEKLFRTVLFIISIISAVLAASHPKPVPSEDYLLHEVLDNAGKFHIYWKFNATHITFELHVKTRGYVGFGISPNGKMYPSDVIIGWVKDGVTHFSDRHTIGHVQPVIDQSQDWILLHGEENNFGTMLKFERPLVTCDGNDTVIVDDTMRMIYAYHPDDPTDEDHLPWHGAITRGARSMLLLSTPPEIKLPDVIHTKDIVHQSYHIPTARTTYRCRVYSLEDITTKQHIVKFDPVIQKDHEPFVHHMILYKCRMPHTYIGKEYDCYNVPYGLMPCGNVVAGWAVGGGSFNFPENAGFPIGENENQYGYIIEMHYNNPGGVAGLVDNSGIRIHYTSKLRQHDAGVITVGILENKQQIIPPHYSDFVEGHDMSPECFNEALQHAPGGEIKAFGLWQHSHLLGKGIKTRHIRGDVELKPLADDKHYDFDYQEIRMLRKEVPLRLGDTIKVECTYDSTNKQNITYGGFSTAEEMCFSFIFYYPKIPLIMSIGTLLYDTIPGHSTADVLDRIVEGYDWSSDAVKAKFQEDTHNTTISEQCILKVAPYYRVKPMKRKEPRVPYTEPSPTCLQS